MNLFNKKEVIKVKRGAIFDTDKLQIDIGRWLRLLRRPVEMAYYEWDLLIDGRLVNLARAKAAKPEVLDSIQPKFLELVNPVINGETIFALFDYDKDKSSFKCEFENGEIVDIKFYYGDMDEGPELILENDKEKNIYDFYSEREDRPARLELRNYTKKLGEDLKFNHHVFDDSYYASLSDRNRSINITIAYKKGVPVEEQVDKAVLEQCICGLDMDASLEDICSAIVKGIKGDVLTVPSIKVEKKAAVIEHHGCSPTLKTQEMIAFQEGKIKNLILIRNGKKVNISNFSSWQFANEKFAVDGNDDQKIYHVTVSADSDKLDEPIIPRNYVNIASKEVEETKKLTLAPIKGNK